MDRDAEATWRPAHIGLAPRAASIVVKRALSASPTCVVPRQSDLKIRNALDQVDLRALHTINLLAEADEICAAVSSFPPLAEPHAERAWSWLRDDALSLIHLFAASANVDVIYVRLRLLEEVDVPEFAARSSPLFLASLYHGPAISWTARGQLSVVGGASSPDPLPESAIVVSSGMAAFLRGTSPLGSASVPTVWRPGELEAGRRLLLTIEDGRSVPFGG